MRPLPTSRALRLPDASAATRGDAFVSLSCQACPLHARRTQVVPAEGGAAPRAFFVGEAPGPDEDAQGRPVVGRAGRILRQALAVAGWPEDDVWITNAVKCFPHEVVEGKRRIRAPRPPEADACRPHLEAEVAALRPRLLVALGRTAAEAVLGRRVGRLAELRGRTWPAREELGGVPVFVTYHPSGLHYGHATVEEFTQDLRGAAAIARTP